MRTLFVRMMLAAAPVLVACSDSLSVNDILGPYTATSFTARDHGGPVMDIIGAGGSMEITLFANGTTTGSLFAPASVTGTGSAITADLAGTFTFANGTVAFFQAADTYIPEATWTADGR